MLGGRGWHTLLALSGGITRPPCLLRNGVYGNHRTTARAGIALQCPVVDSFLGRPPSAPPMAALWRGEEGMSRGKWRPGLDLRHTDATPPILAQPRELRQYDRIDRILTPPATKCPNFGQSGSLVAAPVGVTGGHGDRAKGRGRSLTQCGPTGPQCHSTEKSVHLRWHRLPACGRHSQAHRQDACATDACLA